MVEGTMREPARPQSDMARGEQKLGGLTGFKKRRADWGWRRAIYWQVMHFLGRCGFHIHLVAVVEIDGRWGPMASNHSHR